MTIGLQPRNDASFYAPLGLIANPFIPHPEEGATVGAALEITAASNRLLSALIEGQESGTTRPVLVRKSTAVPGYYGLRAVGHVESMLINDDGLGMLHAYIQLYMMRRGRVRSTLGVVGERLTFRSFELTLAELLGGVIANPDEQLASYAAVSESALAAFAREYEADPVATVIRYFGSAELERRPELSEVVDIRLSGMEMDVDENTDAEEIDASVGNAPGTGIALPESVDDDEERAAVVDYVIEYVDTKLSRVIARGLRMYTERGLAAMSTELKVTKAPRKTLNALVDLACSRFSRVVIMYDGFENWGAIDPEMQQTIIGSLDEMKQLLEGRAVMVLLLEEGRAPEAEAWLEQSDRALVEWGFANLIRLQAEPDVLAEDMIDQWLEAAVAPGAEPMRLTDPVLSALAAESAGSLAGFAAGAAAAIEDAAERGAAGLDEAALAAGRGALMEADA